MSELASLDLRIAPDRIHFLRFILEGYDGLAVLSTIDSRQGHVRLRFASGAREELSDLLRSLGSQLGGLKYLQ